MKRLMLLFLIAILFGCSKSDEEIIYGQFIDTRDGHIYKTVEINGQVWMAENFAYMPWIGKKASNDYKKTIYVYSYTGTVISEAKSNENYQIFGCLYMYDVAIELCPEGWHLPTIDEWTNLINYAGGDGVAGGRLKSSSFEHWNKTTISAFSDPTNDYGFTAAGGGRWESVADYSEFKDIKKGAYYFSSTETSDNTVYGIAFSYLTPWANTHNGAFKRDGYSVRYIKD